MLEKRTNLIIGKVESGKTRGILFKEVKRAIENEENLLILDNKEEYYQTYAEKLKENGYNVQVINFKDTTSSNGFNPLMLPYLLYKNKKTDMAVDLVQDLATSIFKEEKASVDPFWENSASDYFTGLVFSLFKEGKEEEINLGSISVMMNKGEAKIDNTSVLKKYFENQDPLNVAYISASPTVFAPVETKGGILSVTRQKLNRIVMRENLLNMLSVNEVELYDIKEKTVYFVIGNPRYQFLTNIFINQVMQVIKNNHKNFTFVLDNIDTLPKLLYLEDIVTNASYYDVKVYVATKSKEDLEMKYGKLMLESFKEETCVENLTDLIEVGNYDSYPQLEMQEHKYFNIESFVKESL